VGANCQMGRRHKRAVRSSVGAGLGLGVRVQVYRKQEEGRSPVLCGGAAALRGVALGSGQWAVGSGQFRPQRSPRNMRRDGGEREGNLGEGGS
jgi:hypothetical protein